MKLLINLLSKTIGSWSLPFIDKKFNLNHYFLIEKELEKVDAPFAIAVVTTYGHGSNILIRMAQMINGRKTKKTHALAIVETKNGKFRAAEAIGSGIQETTLLSAIGQRDEVKIRIPVMPKEAAEYALKYFKTVLAVDRIKNIPYDLEHDLEDPERYDCAELIFHAVSYGLEKIGSEDRPIPVKRGGKLSWSPAEAEFSHLFTDLYDSKLGFIK